MLIQPLILQCMETALRLELAMALPIQQSAVERCPALPWTALPYTTLHCPALHCPALPCTALCTS